MAGERGGGRHDEADLRGRPPEPGQDHERRPPADGGGEEAEGGGEDGWEGEAPQPVRFFITARRVRIDPARKRENYLRRLEDLIEGLDRIVSDPEGVEQVQLKAMDIMIRAVRMCYHIVRDVDVEMLEDELEALEKENKRGREGAGNQELGYQIEEDPAQ